MDRPDDAFETLRAGCDAYLAKPLAIADVREMVAGLLADRVQATASGRTPTAEAAEYGSASDAEQLRRTLLASILDLARLLERATEVGPRTQGGEREPGRPVRQTLDPIGDGSQRRGDGYDGRPEGEDQQRGFMSLLSAICAERRAGRATGESATGGTAPGGSGRRRPRAARIPAITASPAGPGNERTAHAIGASAAAAGWRT